MPSERRLHTVREALFVRACNNEERPGQTVLAVRDHLAERLRKDVEAFLAMQPTQKQSHSCILRDSVGSPELFAPVESGVRRNVDPVGHDGHAPVDTDASYLLFFGCGEGMNQRGSGEDPSLEKVQVDALLEPFVTERPWLKLTVRRHDVRHAGPPCGDCRRVMRMVPELVDMDDIKPVHRFPELPRHPRTVARPQARQPSARE